MGIIRDMQRVRATQVAADQRANTAAAQQRLKAILQGDR